MTLSVCLLTRNEAASLPPAIESVRAVADEVLVVDTGSTDGTADVAVALGARVVRHAWDDDFAAGRNFSLDHAAGDWVLWLNADEELSPESVERLRRDVAITDAFGYFVRVQHLPSPEAGSAVPEVADLRLFRRRPGVRFVGRVHPAFTDDTVAAIGRDGLRVLPSEVVFRRHTYPSGRTESKDRWTLRLLERELADRPGQFRYRVEYARTLLRLGDLRGHAVMAEAIEQIVSTRGAPAAPSVKAQVVLEYVLSTPPAAYRGRLTRAEAAALAARWFPNSPALIYRVAQHAFIAGDFPRSAALLERLLELARAGVCDPAQPFDPALLADDALINLAACYRQLRRPRDADRCYRMLLKSPRYSPQALDGLAAVAKGGRSDQSG